jgi:hypothetical protein
MEAGKGLAAYRQDLRWRALRFPDHFRVRNIAAIDGTFLIVNDSSDL